ncbi:MAG: hypothetical protein P1P74_05835 [Desulfuromonadales bacterium]|nr:hypothetical protein [Desulfuromonadales bacterium]MDT8423723.1 hypothetical protein [Desulfuromonadales bacterium]
MTQQELSDAVMTLSLEDKKKFIITTLPDLAKDAMEDPAFLLELLPIMLGIVKDSGLDLAQLMPLLGGMSQKPV